MRALTIRQPWASLIALGVKTIETRSWRAPASLIGQHFAIHAGMRSDHAKVMEFDQVWHDHGFCCADDSLPLGAIVATARLVDCVPMTCERLMPSFVWSTVCVAPDRDELTLYKMTTASGEPRTSTYHDVTDQLPYGDFAPGRWAWLLDDVKPTTPPIPAKGRQGLWTWTP